MSEFDDLLSAFEDVPTKKKSVKKSIKKPVEPVIKKKSKKQTQQKPTPAILTISFDEVMDKIAKSESFTGKYLQRHLFTKRKHMQAYTRALIDFMNGE